MRSFIPRAGRRPPPLTLGALVAAAALGACADEPTAPSARSLPQAPARQTAAGDVITVTTTSGGTGAGSLRWAVAQAAGGETIRFDPSLAGRTITLDSTLVIRKYVTIEGPHDRGVTISGGGRGRVIDLTVTTTTDPATTLRNLSITGGKLVSEDDGAGIRAAAPLRLEHSTVWGNEAPMSPAIHVLVDARSATLFNSTVSGNVSTNNGYGAVKAHAPLTVDFSTVAHNSHGGLYAAALGSFTLRSSIIASNGVRNCDHGGYAAFYGQNLSDDASCGDATRMLIGDPKLGALADNGGPGMTHALGALSAAVNVPTLCDAVVDQRHVARPAGQCDLGAFESTDPKTVAFTVDAGATIDPVSGVVRLGGTLQCARDAQFGLQVQLRQRSGVQGVDDVFAVLCGPSAQRWSAVIVPSGGEFRNGGGEVTVAPQRAPFWVTPSTTTLAVKLARPRK